MSQLLRLGMVQIEVEEDARRNLDQALHGIEEAARQNADLVVLPELWNTPFDNASIRLHSHEWETLIEPVCQKARSCQVWVVAGTLPCDDHGRITNRCAIINDQGQIVQTADKLHLLEVHTTHSVYQERDVFEPGQSISDVSTPWGVMAVAICFDVRFPELIRLLTQKANLLVVPAGFNAAVGAKHWLPLLQARAIENEVFVCGVNPQKKEYPHYSSWGHSVLISPDGQILCCMEDTEFVRVIEIDLEQVEAIRKRSPYWACRRLDLYTLEGKENEQNNL